MEKTEEQINEGMPIFCKGYLLGMVVGISGCLVLLHLLGII